MKKPFIGEYVRFKFYDSLGVQVGADAAFSNDEILGEIKEQNANSTTVVKTRAGIAASGANRHPLGFSFNVSCILGTTWEKIDRLLDAVRNNYRISFELLHGRRLWDSGFNTFDEYPLTWNKSVLEIAEQEQRQIVLGVGLRYKTQFAITVYEGITLSLPSQSSGGDDIQIGTDTINLGNGSSASIGVLNINN